MSTSTSIRIAHGLVYNPFRQDLPEHIFKRSIFEFMRLLQIYVTSIFHNFHVSRPQLQHFLKIFFTNISSKLTLDESIANNIVLTKFTILRIAHDFNFFGLADIFPRTCLLIEQYFNPSAFLPLKWMLTYSMSQIHKSHKYQKPFFKGFIQHYKYMEEHIV